MADCLCGEYGPLELQRGEISRRIRATRRIRRGLTLVAESADGRHRLYRCPVCDQSWQQSWSWSFGAKDYIFQVPAIADAEWQEEPFARPDEMLIYTATMSRYTEENDFAESTNPCRMAGCTGLAVAGLVFCFEHHVRSLQAVGLLPKPPQGRMFAPYRFRGDAIPS